MRSLRPAGPATVHAVRRWTAGRPWLTDTVLAAMVATLAVVELGAVKVLPTEREPDAAASLLVILGAGCLACRRRRPVPTLAAVTTVLVLFWGRGYGSYQVLLGLPAIYSVAAHESDRWRAWTAAGTAAMVLTAVAGFTILDPPDGFDVFNLVNMVAYLGGAFGAGTVMRNRDVLFTATQRRADRAEADRLVAAQRAVRRERIRIAREMHDVLAHSMSVIAVQAAAGREIAATDHDKVVQVLAAIEGIGRESVVEMRRMLDVLRDDDGGGGPAPLAPQPTLDDLDVVIAHCVEAGVPTSLRVVGDRRDLSPGLDLAAFRIVQEALTNTIRHGGPGASAAVEIRYRPDSLVVGVDSLGGRPVPAGPDTDPGSGCRPSAEPGNGIIGMKERVEIYDGQLLVGPVPGGGFRVRAALPIGARRTT